MKRRRNQLVLSLLSKKTDSYNDENTLDFRWSNVQEEGEEDIALSNFSECLQTANWWEKISKKVTGWLFNDCCIVPHEKKN